jgi:hypothetical protein
MAESEQGSEWICPADAKRVVIPNSVTVLTPGSFPDAAAVEKLQFQQGSAIRRLEAETFGSCTSLKSISIPAPIEFIGGYCFLVFRVGRTRPSRLEKVTIESGSKLRELADFAFAHCERLRSICLPDSLELIGIAAFADCREVRSISIPRLVQVLRDESFSGCDSLQAVSFAAGSQLRRIGDRVFMHCRLLKSVTVPSNVEAIGELCFSNCVNLETVVFEADSKLVRIADGAFQQCFLLQAICLPPLLQFVGELCFFECCSLSNLTFASPGRLRELLDLPPFWGGWKEIPDSVEHLGFMQYRDHCHEYQLTFGKESKLAEVTTSFDPRGGPSRSLLRITSRSLKRLRCNLEFGA